MSNSLEAKIVILGSQGVGKTSLVHRYVKNAFTNPGTSSTIGASFLTKRVVDIDSSTVVRLQIWDTAGQERFRSISKLYYRGANAGILCYDITDSASFEEMGRWLVELKQNLGEDVILHVVGTKADLVAEHPSRRKVPFERCIAYVAENLYPTQFTQQQQEHKQPQHNAGTPAPQTLNAYVWASGLGGTPAVTTTSTAPVTPAANGGIASPVSNRSSGFWGLDVGWDCCHEISAKDGEGVEEVFRVITRKLVEQRNERLEAEARLLEDVRRTMPSGSYASDGYGGHGGGGDYFSGGRGVANGGSFRVGIGDRRKSWFGVRSGGDGMIGTEAEWEDEIRRRRSEKAGRCC